MHLGNMWVENFMSVREAHMNFQNLGLVLVEGDNQDSEAFESNGAGKSTMASEAPTWAIYGTTIRGRKADKIINREAGKNTKVCLEIIDDNEDLYLIERYRKHKEHKNHVRLFHNGENITGKSDKDTDQLIIDLLDMDFSTFTNSIMFGQGVSKMFSSSTDSEQKKILENMLQIDIYKACQDLAKEKLAEANTKIDGKQKFYDQMMNSKITSERMLEELQDKEAKLEQTVKAKISELQDEQTGYEKELNSLPDMLGLNDDLENFQGLKEQQEKRLERFKEFEDSKNDLTVDLRTFSRDLSKAQDEVVKARKKLADVRSGVYDKDDTCEMCGQPIEVGEQEDTSHMEKHLEATIEKFEKEAQTARDNMEDTKVLIEKVDKLLKAKEPIQESIKTVSEEITEIKVELHQSVTREKEINGHLARISRQIKEQEDSLDTTYTDLIESTISQLRELDDNLKATNKELNKLGIEKDDYEFWVNGFSNQGIKSVLLDSVVPYLNTRANHYLKRLAESSIEVTFNTQQELASGEKRDKFSVDIRNDNGDDDYAGNSNGEKRRIDVAVNMALQDLVLSRSNKRLDLIVFDEVFEGLDEVGSSIVIEILKERASSCGTILVITHNKNLAQLFNQTMTVSKSNGRTVVELAG